MHVCSASTVTLAGTFVVEGSIDRCHRKCALVKSSPINYKKFSPHRVSTWPSNRTGVLPLGQILWACACSGINSLTKLCTQVLL